MWHFMGAGIARWMVCTLLIIGPYFLLGRALMENKQFGKRTYRFAD
jgi:NADH-quinone oxidoreductase subunit H